jgi:hypothetical protein
MCENDHGETNVRTVATFLHKRIKMLRYAKIVWHVDPLIGNDRETSNYTTAIAT